MQKHTLEYFQGQIDGIDFTTIAGYLKNPRAPIDFLVHVRDEKMLAELAVQLASVGEHDLRAAKQVADHVQSLMEQGAVLLSTRFIQPSLNAKHVVEPSIIPGSADCRVIYMPPCYLVHTPGLFEGTWACESVANEPGHATRQNKGIRIKP